MQIGLLRISKLVFPGRAGELQRAGRTAALVVELGDNYRHYHDWLAEQLTRFDKPPHIEDYTDSKQYVADWALIQDVVRAEALLRTCLLFRRKGRPLNYPLDFTRGQKPLVDHDSNLVAFD